MTTETEFKKAREQALQRMRDNAADMQRRAEVSRQKGHLCRAAEHEATARDILRTVSRLEANFRSET